MTETPLSPAEIMQRFISLGDNCEFGFVQRHFGAEPLDLLRWAGNMSLPRLIEGIASGFEGLAEAGFTHWLSGERQEYMLTEVTYGLTYHTFRFVDEISYEALVKEERTRLLFLKRKFLMELREPDRVFVYRKDDLREDDAANVETLFNALRFYGENKLLVVSTANGEDEPGSTHRLGEGFYKAYRTRLTNEIAPWIAPFDEWLKICTHVSHDCEKLAAKTPMIETRENVRLVIWDLDDTFWKGTVTEGGITEYVQYHNDIVVELAKRGIMSSICSKNNDGQIRQILSENNILEYFVFPSINWEPKGNRVAAIIDSMQLRPATVMFIDDNPNVRAEVAAIVPEIQIADETFISKILSSPLFAGKDDRALSRLAQYKLLEKRASAEGDAGGDNKSFLRSCNIRVSIKDNIAEHVDRAIELINRTNQLNYTKRRLPADADGAREVLLREVSAQGCQAGLVHVVDNYGDYGLVGFFLKKSDADGARLLHYCFSCRTLGMGIETWLFKELGRPELTVSGEVISRCDLPEDIDWISYADGEVFHENAAVEKIPEIRIFGGCEANPIAHFLIQNADKVLVEDNFASGALFVRVNSSSMLLSAANRDTPEFAVEMVALELPHDRMVSRFFDDVIPGTVLVFSAQLDSGYAGYRHKIFDWNIKIEPEECWDDLTTISEPALDQYLTRKNFDQGTNRRIKNIVKHLKQNYISVHGPNDIDLTRDMREIFTRTPPGAGLIVIVPGDLVRTDGKLTTLDWVTSYIKKIRLIAGEIPFVKLIYINDHVQSNDEILDGWNHYDRKVYFRVANAILNLAKDARLKS